MWLFYQIIANLGIVAKQSMYRGIKGWWVWPLVIGCLLIAEPAFRKAFNPAMGHTFFQNYFFSIAALSVIGWLVSMFIFKESPNIYQYIGASLAIGGSLLIVR